MHIVQIAFAGSHVQCNILNTSEGVVLTTSSGAGSDLRPYQCRVTAAPVLQLKNNYTTWKGWGHKSCLLSLNFENY